MSDGWGEASGIEGNYEADDDEEQRSTDTRNETTETSSTTTTQETNQTTKTSRTKTNIKDEWNGRTIYIPDTVLSDLEDTYLETQLKLRKEGQAEFKKNRHFYPLLVEFGLEALADADVDTIQDRLNSIDE